MITNTVLDMPFAQFAEIETFEVNVASVSRSPFDGTQQVQSFTGQYWRARLRYPELNRARGEAVSAFLSKLAGPAGTFLLPETTNATPRGTAASLASSPTLDGSSQVGQTITVRGTPVSETGWLLAGDVIQIGPSSRARFHRVLDDVDTDATGRASINIWPSIRQPNFDGDAMEFSNAKGLFLLDEPTRKRLVRAPFRYDIEIACSEVLDT